MSKEKQQKWGSTTGPARGVQIASTLTQGVLRCSDKIKSNKQGLVIFLRKQGLQNYEEQITEESVCTIDKKPAWDVIFVPMLYKLD